MKTTSGLTKVVNVSQARLKMVMLEYNSNLSKMVVKSTGGTAEYVMDVLTSGGYVESNKASLVWVSTENRYNMRVQGVIVDVIDTSLPNEAQSVLLSINDVQRLNSGGSKIDRLRFNVGIGAWPNPSNPPIQITTNFNMRLIADGFSDTDFVVSVAQTHPNYK